MTNPVVIILGKLLNAGFATADQDDFTDKPMTHVCYVSRVHSGQHQYVSVVTSPHDSSLLCEVVVEVFTAKRMKRGGGVRLYSNVARSLDDLLPMIAKVYELPKSNSAKTKPKTSP